MRHTNPLNPCETMGRLSEEDRATLVAYLDNELDDQASRELEARLSRDPALRAEADALKRTWDLLDYLPKAEPSHDFTHRTMERLAVRDTGTVAPAHGSWSWMVPVGWAVAMLVALGGGLFVANRIWPPVVPATPTPNVAPNNDLEKAIAADLPVIRKYRELQYIDDLEMWMSLSQPELFGEASGSSTGVRR